MNVITRERQLDEPAPPPPPARIRHREFNDVRAGRLVAESINASLASAAEYLEKVLVRSREVWEVVIRDVPFTVSARQIVITPIPRRAFDADIAGVLLRREVADIALVTPEDDKEDDAIVQWFVEQHAAATQGERTQVEVAQVEEEDEDVMLTLPGGSGSTRSWRGGGTMRQR